MKSNDAKITLLELFENFDAYKESLFEIIGSINVEYDIILILLICMVDYLKQVNMISFDDKKLPN